jgi:glycerol-3-phosphate cytidylyltransferase-like family protein
MKNHQRRLTMSREFIDAITAGDNLEAEGIFAQTMADKVGNALEVKRTELSSTFVKNVESETEEDDEV